MCSLPTGGIMSCEIAPHVDKLQEAVASAEQVLELVSYLFHIPQSQITITILITIINTNTNDSEYEQICTTIRYLATV